MDLDSSRRHRITVHTVRGQLVQNVGLQFGRFKPRANELGLRRIKGFETVTMDGKRTQLR